MNTPLAERMRPKSLADYFGQEHLVGPEGSLTQMITHGVFPSLIFWGPPGTGKTTLAQLLALEKERPFYQLSAINAGVKEIREIINKAEHSGGLFSGKSPILFIDEIHRFSKSQQDSLLNAVEKGIITLIGATTENPSFEVINALLSRCQVYTLNTLDKENLEKINADFLSSRMDQADILNTIKTVYEKFNIILDPHSAIGYGAFDKVNLKGNNVVLATAHPCKFPDAIEKAINLKAELPNELAFVLDEKENYDIIENNLNKIKQHIKERI